MARLLNLWRNGGPPPKSRPAVFHARRHGTDELCLTGEIQLKMMTPAQKKWIQILHVAKRECGLDDDAYRAVLAGAWLRRYHKRPLFAGTHIGSISSQPGITWPVPTLNSMGPPCFPEASIS